MTTSPNTPLIEMKEVSKTYQLDSGTDIRVLDGVNLNVYDHEVVALLGPSGSGKSTLLRIMSGLTRPTAGEMLNQGRQVVGINPDVSLVFQSFALFPWETVHANIELALAHLHLPRKEIRLRVRKVIDLVGLEGFEEAYPRELSGGMKQRVGVARALVMERPILLLDEPFSALDVLTADTLRTEILRIFTDKKTSTKSMVLVTHNIQEAVFMAKRILVMGINPGHVRLEIANDLPYPRDESSPAFKRMVTQLHGLITEALMPDVPVPATAAAAAAQAFKEPPVETLPNVQITEMIGLLEAIADQGGRADIFELAQLTAKEFGRTLYLVKSAELLDLVDTPKQTVVLTELGTHFVRGDINMRKRMLHELFGSLRLVKMTANLLRREEQLRLSIDTLTERVAEWLPNENPHEVVQALVAWGRFAEFLGYNDNTREVYLDQGQDAV